MADDLIQRLRDEQTDGWAGDACAVSCALADEAAARIEALEAENTRLRALLDEALEEVKKHREMRKRLDRRIHNQRKAWRDNWQVIEKRAVIPAHLGSWRERNLRHTIKPDDRQQHAAGLRPRGGDAPIERPGHRGGAPGGGWAVPWRAAMSRIACCNAEMRSSCRAMIAS